MRMLLKSSNMSMITTTLFLALSELELGRHEDSEKTYLRATDLQPKQVLAWQVVTAFVGKDSYLRSNGSRD
jgi:hypothetical protein